MTQPAEDLAVVTFDRFQLLPAARRLLRDGQPVKVSARAFDVLTVLVRNAGRVVSADECLRAVWPGLVVEKNNLEVHVSALRKLLGPSLLTTVSRRGYCFTGPVAAAGDQAGRATLEPAAGDRLHVEGLEIRPREGVVVTDGRRHRLSAMPSAARRTPQTPSPSAAHGLPQRVPSLIGRDAELAELGQRLGQGPLVTLCGPAGVGKTSLALAAAHQLSARHACRDGAGWVDLSAQNSAAAVVPATAQALGVRLVGRRPALDELTAALAPQRLLLVLDNCEHLLEPVRAMAAVLRAQAPGVQLLVTSRQRLDVADECVVLVQPLCLPGADSDPVGAGHDAFAQAAATGAIRLFVERARAHGHALDGSSETLRSIGDLCRQLDGLPLAIELAAARVPLLGVQGVRDRLIDGMKLLRARQGADGPAMHGRQTSIRAAFDWSHSLLTPAEQVVYRRLSVFAGGFTPSLAQQVVTDPRLDAWEALDHLDSLLEKSLLATDGHEPPRLRMLDTAQAHAREFLRDAQEQPALRRRHAAAVGDLFDQTLARRDEGQLDDYAFADALVPEMPNARLAIDQASRERDADAVAVLADAAGALLFAVGRGQEALQWLQALHDLVTAGDASPVAAARFRLRLGRCGCNGRLPDARVIALLRQAADALRGHGEQRRLHECLWMLAESLLDTDEVAAARACLADAAALEAWAWHPVYRVRRQRVEAMLLEATGTTDAALAVLGEAIVTAVDQRLTRWELILRSDRAKLQLLHDQLAQAEPGYEQVVQRAQHAADHILLADSLIGLATCQAGLGRADSARRTLHQGATLWKRSGLLLSRGAGVAWVLLRIGDEAAAARWLGAVQRHRRQLGNAGRDARFDDTLRALPRAGLTGAMAAGELLAVDALLELVTGPPS